MTEFAEPLFNSRDYLPTDDYIRLDEEMLLKHPTLLNGNAFHDTLRGDRMVATYEVYQKRDCEEIACILKFGDRLNGHKGIVHGGIISTAFDNSFGWLFFTFSTYPAFTANLSVNFRKPLYENSIVILRAKLEKKEGRKIFMTATLEDLQGAQVADSTSLFIRPKDIQLEPVSEK